MLASNELSRHNPGPLLDSKALCATVRMWVNRTQSDPMFAAIRLPLTVRFSEGRSTKKPAPSFRERSESETVTLRLLATCTPLPLAGNEGRYVWFVSQTEMWAIRISEELVTNTP